MQKTDTESQMHHKERGKCICQPNEVNKFIY